jgi:flagellar FliL protein
MTAFAATMGNSMSQTDITTAPPPRKPFGRALIVGLVLAVLGGAGGFYATYSGLLPLDRLLALTESEDHRTDASHSGESLPDFTFVPIEPVIVSLRQGAQTRHLRFRAELEVPLTQKSEVERLTPRVVDVLNTYLRALRLEDLEDSSGLVRLRAQMLRRVQIVTGADRVNDLLIMEFVLN